MLQKLEQWDKDLFLLLNGEQSKLVDFIMVWASDKLVWVPLYLILLYWLFKHHKAYGWMALCLGLLIFISDQTASGLLKPWVQRLRPCHDPEMSLLTYTPSGCGGKYGFVSSHAANMFAIATFCWLNLKGFVKYIGWLFPWAALIAYSRIYLGVHYPGDVIVGALIGILSALICFSLFKVIRNKRSL